MSDSLNAWCSLLRASGVGVKNFHALLAAFASPEAFFNASAAEIKARLPQLKTATWQRWQAALGSGMTDVEWCAGGNDRHIICWHDDLYPPLLREIDDPPPVLFVLGDPKLLSQPQLAIVGSRNATEPAQRTCFDFARSFSGAGFSICSGLALGIDGAAHRGALAAGGKTVAVVGTGLDRVYPARHHDLAHDIAQQGALVSEFPIGTPPRSQHFPRRNRIISALSVGVLVVEASLHSGSLITARTALEQGREVFAIPGSIHNPLVKGCHHLIKQGAKLVESAADVLEELPALTMASITMAPPSEMESAIDVSGLSDAAKAVLTAIGYEVCHADALISQLKLTSEELSAILSELELEGHLVALGGGLFQRNTTFHS